MKKVLLLFVVIVFAFSSCKKEESLVGTTWVGVINSENVSLTFATSTAKWVTTDYYTHQPKEKSYTYSYNHPTVVMKRMDDNGISATLTGTISNGQMIVRSDLNPDYQHILYKE